MKSNVKNEKQKKPKVKIGDKFANAVFGEIIDTLIKARTPERGASGRQKKKKSAAKKKSSQA